MKTLLMLRAATLAVAAMFVTASNSITTAAAATDIATSSNVNGTASSTIALPHDAHLVSHLPGLAPGVVTFKHYAGRLELETREKLFYWYTESQESPETAPVVLWLNGGPGCSSLGGFFTENGPFVVNADLSVRLNRHAWNRKANVVWLESPAGVGFSTPLQDAAYYNDDVVAAKARAFLALFFAQYPELQGRKFYITGESYAGMYIPYLVDLLVREPLEGVDFAGFAVGNAYTDNQIDNSAYVDYFYSHGLISLENYREMQRVCSRANIGCVYTGGDCTPECRAVLEEGILAMDEDQYDPYFIYGDKCLLNANQATALRLGALLAAPAEPAEPTTASSAMRSTSQRRRLETAAAWNDRTDIAPCADTFTQMYLNQKAVQTAIHVDSDAPAAWTSCSDLVGELFTSSDSSLPKYRHFLNKGLDVLIYSGDADSVVNFIGTQRWIGEEGLKLRVTDKWKAWFGPDAQLAGYVQGYEGLTFKTVKGAGHMVPAVKPLHGLYMFECFVFGDTACATFTYPIDAEEIESGAFAATVQSASLLTGATADGVGASSNVAWAYVGVMCIAVAAAVVGVRSRLKRSEYETISSRV